MGYGSRQNHDLPIANWLSKRLLFGLWKSRSEPLRDTNLVWIPVGSLNGDLESEIAVRLHISSSATWERESADCVQLEAGPESLDALNKALQRTSR